MRLTISRSCHFLVVVPSQYNKRLRRAQLPGTHRLLQLQQTLNLLKNQPQSE